MLRSMCLSLIGIKEFMFKYDGVWGWFCLGRGAVACWACGDGVWWGMWRRCYHVWLCLSTLV